MRRSCCILAVFIMGVSLSPRLAAQEVIAQRSCEGLYEGMTLAGGFQLERWMTARSYRYYGAFHDPYGNVYELEVMTPNLAGGTGSTWLNGARHRETFINLQVLEGGFIVRTEEGIVVQFQCRPPGG